MTVDSQLAKGPNGDVYLVTRRMDGKKLALKHISIPTSEAQTKALIYSGAARNEADAQRYYNSLVKELKSELLLINGIKNSGNLLKFRGYQVDQKYIGVGYDVYLLSDFCQSLPNFLADNPLTKLQAINLAIDLCSALEQLRTAGLIHRDVHPRNIFWGTGSNPHFLLGDLGVVPISELPYSAMPDASITDYTAPEVLSESATLSETMDVYGIGLVLYEIYNGGVLSLGSEGRTAEPLPTPAYADVALSEILLKACAFSPEDRYQSPADMKQALMLYLQRGDVSDDLLVPPPPAPEPDPSDASVDVSEIAATIAAGQAAEHVASGAGATDPEAADSEPTDPEAVTDDSQVETEIPAPPAEPEPPKPSLNDLGEDELMLPSSGDISVDDFMSILRRNPGLEVFSMDNEGNMTTVPGYETEETLPDDTEFVDSADNQFAILQKLGEIEDENSYEEAPAAEEIQEPVPDDNADTATPEALEAPQEAPQSAPRRRSQRRPEPQDDINVYDDGYEEDLEDDEPEEGGTWKKVLITVIVLLVLAGGSFGLYLFKTDTIRDMGSQVLSSTSVMITAESKNSTAMEVICSSADGEVMRLPYLEAGTTFTGLSPDTTYTFTLSSSDGKFLLGSKTLTAKTSEMTNINGFAASSLSAVSATLAVSGTGPVPETWVVTLTSDTGENLTFESADIPIELSGLTPNTLYTATLSSGDGDTLGGTTTCQFTTMEYTTLSTFTSTDVTTSSVSVAWSYTGTVPDSWTVSCTGTDGTATTQEVTGESCTLDGLVSGETYTITLSCPSLQETELSTISVGIPSVTITNITSVAGEDGQVQVDWDYTGDITPTSWRISYAYISAGTTDAVTPTTVTSDTNSVTLEGLIPNTSYQITVVGADDLSVGGNAETTCLTGDAENFTDYGCENANLTMYVLEDNEDGLETSSDTFTTAEHIAFAIEVDYEATEEDKTVTTTYVIRDSSGNPYQVYNSERTWSGTWTTARHTADLPNPIDVPGMYTLEVYFNGQFLASADFTVS
jgi:serine/threonine protein kinase